MEFPSKFKWNHKNLLGVTVQNVVTDIGDGSLPVLIKLGLGKEFDLIKEDDFTVASDMLYTLKEKITVNFGAEFWYEDFIAARAGYILGQDTGNISFGVGFKEFLTGVNFQLDYALVLSDVSGLTHRISLQLGFGDIIPEKYNQKSGKKKSLYQYIKTK